MQRVERRGGANPCQSVPDGATGAHLAAGGQTSGGAEKSDRKRLARTVMVRQSTMHRRKPAPEYTGAVPQYLLILLHAFPPLPMAACERVAGCVRAYTGVSYMISATPMIAPERPH